MMLRSLLRNRTALLVGVCGPVSLVAAGLLSGCAMTSTAPSAAVIPAFGGTVHGGQSPIENATVTLYHTNPAATGYGQAGILVGTATSDAGGNFSIAPSATTANCPAGSQAYITAAGGYQSGSSSQTNNSMLLMAALGDCANISSSTRVVINEVTTVAAAYALSSFTTTSASGPLFVANVSAPAANSAQTGTATAAAGLVHAFMNAANLVNYASGTANSQTANITVGSATVNGVVPTAEINMLGNIMMACVDGATGNSSCTSLFGFTPSISGTVPVNTLQSMINLARNPYPSAAAMDPSTGLFVLAPPTPAFLPQLSAQPPDWTIAIVYNNQNPALTYNPGTPLIAPYNLALDANDTVFYGGSGAANIVGLSAYGTATPSFTAATAGSATRQVATDTLGNVWVGNNSSLLLQYSATAGGAPTQTTFAGGDIAGVAVDAASNVWIGNAVSNATNVIELAAGSNYTQNYTATIPTYEPVAMTIDSHQNVWAAPYFTGGTIAAVLPNLSAANSAATPTYATSGTVATPITATLNGTTPKPLGLVVDASGNAWYGITGSNSVTTTGIEEVIPSLTSSVITGLNPQALIANATLGAKASQLPGIDGAGTIYLPDNQGSGNAGFHAYSTVSVSSTGTGTQVLSPPAGYLGCVPTTTAPITCQGAINGTMNQTSHVITPAYTYAVYNPRVAVIDSTGSLWGGVTTGGVTQIIGVAAPSWPLLSLGRAGVAPGLTSPMPLP